MIERDWTYTVNNEPNLLHTGKWHCDIGIVELERLTNEYKAYVFLNGKIYRLNEMFVSADVAKAAVERTWKGKQKQK